MEDRCRHSSISIPPTECVFEDDGAFYSQSQYVEGVSMRELGQKEKEVVLKKVRAARGDPASPLKSDVPGIEL